ncbi:putative porin [Draconibacterium sp. IB214405]|uniref:putative porin n=1 Tax=Draconibacterium sp. IB214405 TaxID=3097352 RepID=UPI002A15D43C|nr:putative porin [Draconibacterium sp. IB214405]MDX8340996.1 putative porin [Draconibacterium sp. IB214405]
MLKAHYFLFTLLVLIVMPVLLMAQPPEGMRMQNGEGNEEVKKEKEVKSKIGLWYLKGDGAFQDSTKLDTLHDYSHIYHPVFKNAITATYTGNYGNAGMTNDFFQRENQTYYFFLQSRQDYLLTPAKVKYFNTTTPYTRFDFSQSENKSRNNETRFDVIHSQNVTPFWNLTFRTNQEKSDGQYNSQDAKDNFVALTTSFNRDEWNIHGGFISNSIKNSENGGLIADSIMDAGQKPEYWAVNLSEAKSKFNSINYYTTAEYRIGKYDFDEVDSVEVFRPILGILYNFEHDRYTQSFLDEEDTTNTFFENTYYGADYTTDEIKYNRISNLFQLKQYENPNRKYTFGKRAFLGYELYRGSTPGVEVDTVHRRYDIKYSNLYIGGGIFREMGSFWLWNFDGKVNMAGRNAGELELNGIITKPFKFWGDSTAAMIFSGSFENRVPDYFQETFYSNHFKWNNDFDAEQRLTLGAKIRVPQRKLELAANYAAINNYLYNNTDAIPDQTTNELLVMSVYADKDFNYRRFHFRTRLLWQKVSEERYLHLPEWSAFVNTYYQFTISKVLFTQIGADVRYNTKYYADAYAPSTGLFYLQNEEQYGDYPYIDIYANLRLKRTRVFFKWMNIGTNFLDGRYMTTPNYPMPRATFRLGVSWAWYD